MATNAEFNHGFIKGQAGDGLLALNLSAMPWIVGTGLGLDESKDWQLDSPTGGETMFAHHLLGEIRKRLSQVESDDAFASALRKSSEAHAEMIALLPREGRLRHEAFSMLEQSIDSRIGGSLRRFTAMKLYLNQEPSTKRSSIRKFKGANSLQVIVNLSEYGYRFFRFHGKQHEDIDISSLLPEWNDDPDEYIDQLEGEIRMLDMAYFRRMREAAESGTTYLLLPRGPERRKRAMESFLTILDKVPTGSIDLRNANVRRIYPGATKTGELR